MNPRTEKKILIVEDDNLLLITLTHQFQEAGYQVTTALNGEEGLRIFDTETPDAVVMDVMMPKKDGIQMLEEIRETHPDSNIPFIILSNAGDMDYVARAMESGSVAYVVKSDRQIDSIVKLVDDKLGIKNAKPE